jgi:hypothetical protein
MNIIKNTDLEKEVIYFHDQFFTEVLHNTVIERYVAANMLCLPDVNANTASMIENIIYNKLDVEAIEYAFRIKQRNNDLTKKIQILFYLVEVRASYFPYFFNCRSARLLAVKSILFVTIRTVYKYLKGNYLIWRFKLV